MLTNEPVPLRLLAWLSRRSRWLRAVGSCALGTLLVRSSWAGGLWGLGALAVMFGLLWIAVVLAEEASE